jgi:lambda family phage portal protein
MWPLKMLEGYMESEAVAARVSAAKMGFWTRKANETTVGEITTDPDTNTIMMDATPGTFDFAPDGYDLAPWDANHPNTAYAEFVKAKLREIASGLGMSYNALANDLEGVNYSSLRSGLLIEHDVWRTIQEWWIGSFLDRVYREWMDSALLSGSLVLDSRDFRKVLPHEFFPRGWPWVDPEKDTKAGIMGIQSGLTSRRRLVAEQGLDLESIFEELKAESDMAKEMGIDISGPPPPSGFGAAPTDLANESNPVLARANGNYFKVFLNGHRPGRR